MREEETVRVKASGLLRRTTTGALTPRRSTFDLRSIARLWSHYNGRDHMNTEETESRRSGRIEARIGLRMMPTFPRSPLSFRTASFPQYGWKAGLSDGAFPTRRAA